MQAETASVQILPPRLALSGAQAALRARRMVEARAARPGVARRSGLLVWLPVAMSVGIALWFALRFEPGALSYLAALGAGAVALALALRASRLAESGRIGWDRADVLRFAGLGGAAVAAGFLLCGLRLAVVEAPVLHFRHYGVVEGRVEGIDRSARDRIRVTLTDLALAGIDPDETPRRLRLSLMEGAPPAIGARVRTIAHLGPPPGPAEPGGFDFRRNAYFAGLGAIGYTRNPFEEIAPPQPRASDAVARLRLTLAEGIRAGIPGQEGAVAAALMTGDRSGIAEATNQLMRDSNLYHIVSISGLHMSMLAAFIYAALRLAAVAGQAVGALPLGWRVHKAAALGALAAAAAYLALAGASEVPTLRAFLMVAVMLVAILADRRAISLRTVALAAIVILALSPDALVSPGFQMSFAATVALVVTAAPWARATAGWPWLLRAPAMLVASSLVAGLATGPIAAAHFGRASSYGMLANLLAVPVMGGVVMPAGVIAALLAPLGLAGPALWVMGAGTGWMLAVAEWVAAMRGAVFAVPSPHPLSLPLIASGAVVATLMLDSGRAARPVLVAAALAILAGVGLWSTAHRPALLISADGTAVGLMTQAGRALSKPAAAFVAANWAEGDGETVTVEEAAARRGWSGPANTRAATLGGRQILHITGEGAVERADAMCRGGAVLIVSTNVKLSRERALDCVLFDSWRLRRTGAVGLDIASDGRLLAISDAELSGRRAWSARSRPWAIPEALTALPRVAE